jgi:amidophosphoribosyltransferase
MSGILGLSYKSTQKEAEANSFRQDLFWGTFYLQHLDQGFGGIASLDKEGEISSQTHHGLFRQSFENDLDAFMGPVGISCISGATREPYYLKASCFPPFAIAFTGNIQNAKDLLAELAREKRGLERTDEAALIAHLMVKNGFKEDLNLSENILKALTFVAEKIQGSFAVVILIDNKVYAARGPDGHKTLVWGFKDGAVMASSESSSFYNQGFRFSAEIMPGEVAVLTEGEISPIGIIQPKKRVLGLAVKTKKVFGGRCIFDHIYYGNPPSIMDELTAGEFRRRTGAAHARRDMEKGFVPDLVIPVPDSGRFHALGYHQENLRWFEEGKIKKLPRYDELLIKYSFSGRSFTPVLKIKRLIEGSKKIVPAIETSEKLAARYRKMVVVVVDDSLVRGTQTQSDLIPKLLAIGFLRENIHLRFAYPKILSPCPWAKSVKDYSELAALDPKTGRIRTDEEIAAMLGIGSCAFNLPADLAGAVELKVEQFCHDCAKQREK